jgi:hypothetical protein
VVHEVAQIASRARQPLTKILGPDLQHLGRYRIAHVEDRAEDVAQTLLTIETQQHA